ncbi:ribosomal protein S18-alanine N-acetyltransferase [Homoserinimonas sp. A447]
MAWMLRRAGEDDLNAIMAIETATFEADAWSTESMRAELRSPHTYYLVAVRVDEPDEVDGYAGLLAPVGAGDADIQTIAVAASARRQGLGRTLMRQLMTEAHQRGAARLFLDVRADNPGAQKLYKALGFEPIAVRAGYYQPDNVDAVVMRHTLLPLAPRLAGGSS